MSEEEEEPRRLLFITPLCLELHSAVSQFTAAAQDASSTQSRFCNVSVVNSNVESFCSTASKGPGIDEQSICLFSGSMWSLDV